MGRPKLDSTTLTVRLLPVTLAELGPEPSSTARGVLEEWGRRLRRRADRLKDEQLDRLIADNAARGDGAAVEVLTRALVDRDPAARLEVARWLDG